MPSSTRKIQSAISALFAMAALLCVHACTGHDGNAEIRIAWRPDSTVTGADSCIQRYYMKGDRLGSYVWCPSSAEAYMKAEQAIEVILSRREAASLVSFAGKVGEGENALGKGIETLQPGDAIVWKMENGTRVGFKVHIADSPPAGTLQEEIRAILAERRNSVMQ